jgi:hypothetical protein
VRAVVYLINPAGQMQDFFIPLLGRPTVVVFSDLDAARELAEHVAAAWEPAGYGATAATLDADTDQAVIDAWRAQWPEHDNVFLPDSHPAVTDLMKWLRAGGRLGGPEG